MLTYEEQAREDNVSMLLRLFFARAKELEGAIQ
jgi:hypothetical protein